MKLNKKTNTLKNSTGTFTFNMTTKEAYSYDWFKMCGYVGDKFVVNSNTFSNATAKHYRQMMAILNDQGIEPDLYIHFPRGMGSPMLALLYLQQLNNDLLDAIKKPRSNARKNAERADAMDANCRQMNLIKSLFNL